MSLKIGIFSFAHMHAYSYASAIINSPGVTIAGITDTDAMRGNKAADEFETQYFSSERELLEEDLDGVIVTSENVHHRSLVEQAANAGVKAILCEKPIATSLEDAKSMIKCCEKQGVKLYIAFPCRYSPAFRSLKRTIHNGAIGEVLAIRGTNRGKVPGGWFVDRRLSGGGAIIDHTVHVADLNYLLLGCEATEVYAESGNGFYHDTWEDTGVLTISYENGVVSTLDTSWSKPNCYPAWGDVTLQVVGSQGISEMDMFAEHMNCYRDNEGRAYWLPLGVDIDECLIADYIRAVGGQDAPDLATGIDGLRTLNIALSAYKSVDDGRPVPIHPGRRF